MASTGSRGNAPAFWHTETYERSIATADYYPGCALDVTAGLSAARIGDLWDGFFVRPEIDGVLYAITLQQYLDNKKSVTGLVPTKLYATAGNYEFQPVVYVFAHDDATYPSATSNINIAIVK